MQRAWNEKYVGQAVLALRQDIEHHCKMKAMYAPYMAIVQSSGCGKSRLVDEFGKGEFVIPMNLRNPSAKGTVIAEIFYVSVSTPLLGFPPADKPLYLYFEALHKKSDKFKHISAFFVALFDKCKSRLDLRTAAERKESTARWFRRVMTEEQTMDSTNDFRTKFYEDVVREADRVSCSCMHRVTSPHLI